MRVKELKGNPTKVYVLQFKSSVGWLVSSDTFTHTSLRGAEATKARLQNLTGLEYRVQPFLLKERK